MHTACILCVFLSACVWFRDVIFFSDAPGMVCVRLGTCFYIDTSDSLLWLTFTRSYTIPDAPKKDVTPRNQTHATRQRTGRMPCASSFRNEHCETLPQLPDQNPTTCWLTRQRSREPVISKQVDSHWKSFLSFRRANSKDTGLKSSKG